MMFGKSIVALTLTLSPVAGAAAPEPTPPVVQNAADDTRCPSEVVGARTKIQDTDDGVAITITGKDARAGREVVRRAMALASVRQVTAPPPGTKPHECVVAYYPGSEASMETTRNGVRVTLRALKEEDVDDLRAKVKARSETAVDAEVQ